MKRLVNVELIGGMCGVQFFVTIQVKGMMYLFGCRDVVEQLVVLLRHDHSLVWMVVEDGPEQ